MTISLDVTGTLDSCEKLIGTLRTAKRLQKTAYGDGASL